MGSLGLNGCNSLTRVPFVSGSLIFDLLVLNALLSLSENTPSVQLDQVVYLAQKGRPLSVGVVSSFGLITSKDESAKAISASISLSTLETLFKRHVTNPIGV